MSVFVDDPRDDTNDVLFRDGFHILNRKGNKWAFTTQLQSLFSLWQLNEFSYIL